jgi:HlyD family secretion protein
VTTLQKLLIGGGVVVVIAAIVAASMLSRPSEKGEEVYMAKAETKDVSSFVQATGRIEARTKVNVQSSVIGQIVQLPVKEGDTVKKGDLLVQIDPTQFKAEVDRLEAAVRTQTISIEQAKVSLADTKRRYDRNKALYGSGGLVSEQDLEASELAYKTASINLESAQEGLSEANAALASARDQLAKTTIVSPIDGTVTQLNAEKGEITLTGTMNNPGTVIMIVSDMGEILATVDVDETRVTQVKTGQKARVVVDAVGDAHPFVGKVVEIAGSAVQRTGQQSKVFEVKIALEDVNAHLRPGMTAKARIETQSAPHVVTVPIQAVMLRPVAEVEKAAAKGKGAETAGASPSPAASPSPSPSPSPSASASPSPSPSAGEMPDEKKQCVFVVENGKARLRAVKTGISDETSVVILEGLEDGQTVVTGPYRALRDLKDGDAVKEKKAGEGEAEALKVS